ncbi:MAG: hypothetical protein DRR16_19720 [Candidatus Parabeggiatoa sp. nov. 3]|nr:MAG: hypothetical protein DRR00_24110 [Gammaproteobacteria bacterium]RKZ61134.1 MAG: hypothetical protein DRQ99_20930 [Gammaproteobacteria bacterium]RKZ82420.1 MAG: hypothetical protein DRR16_19720 [Gammaproteobacteria bacterium]
MTCIPIFTKTWQNEFCTPIRKTWQNEFCTPTSRKINFALQFLTKTLQNKFCGYWSACYFASLHII